MGTRGMIFLPRAIKRGLGVQVYRAHGQVAGFQVGRIS
jgi:hypothetical protein